MAYTTQYIGSRYVPLFAEPAEWNSARTYEPLTIVMHDGNSYTSRQYVPAGIEITNEKFWALTGNYNAQVEAYRKEVATYKKDTDSEIKKYKDDLNASVDTYKKDTDSEIEKYKDDLNALFGIYVPFDTTPTVNSNKGVTSGGVYNRINALNNDINKNTTTVFGTAAYEDTTGTVQQNSADVPTSSAVKLYVDSKTNDKITQNQAASITMNMLTNEVKNALTGGSTPVVGDYSVGTQNIENGGVSFQNLNSLFANNVYAVPTIKYADESDIVKTDGVLPEIVDGKAQNSTTSFSGKCALYFPISGGDIVGVQSTYGLEWGRDNKQYPELIFTDNDNNVLLYANNFQKAANNQLVVQAPKNATRVWSRSDKMKLLYKRAIAYIWKNSELAIVNQVDYSTGTYVDMLDENLVYSGDDEYITESGDVFSAASYFARVYYIRAGEWMHIKSNADYNVTSYSIFDMNYNQLGTSGHGVNTDAYVRMPCCGFVCFSGKNDNQYRFELKRYISGKTDSPLRNKTVLYTGDSITESRDYSKESQYANIANGGAYPKLISDLTGNVYKNYAVGGATISAKPGTDNMHICESIANMQSAADIVSISGGINDYWRNTPLGTIDLATYSDTFDDTVFASALEHTLQQCIDKWPNAQIVYVITHKCQNSAYYKNNVGHTFADYVEVIYKACEKYSVRVIDMFANSSLNGFNKHQAGYFIPNDDAVNKGGTHPTKEGYELFYVPYIKNVLESIIPIASK